MAVANAAENRHGRLAPATTMGAMLELRLRSGTRVAFDGRIVEVFDGLGPSMRFHVAQLRVSSPEDTGDGGRAVSLGEPGVTLAFDGDEAPACARLLAAIGDAQAAAASDA